MELKSTQLGQRLAQHPYNKVRLLNAGIEVSGEKHQYLIPFNQLLNIHCKRGLVWGELEFELPNEQVVRLHGTEWKETQHFYCYLKNKWQLWSNEMSEISAVVLSALVDSITQKLQQHSWLEHSSLVSIQQLIEQKFAALPLPITRLVEFNQCYENYLYCLSWLNEGEQKRHQVNQQWSCSILEKYADFFQKIETTPLNTSQCHAVINGEKNVLVLAGAGSGKHRC